MGLLKIPAEALLKEAQVEIGSLKALIDEKDYEIDVLKQRIKELEGEAFAPNERHNLRREALKEARRTEVFESQSREIEALRKRLREGRNDRDTLLCTISALRRKLEQYENNQ